MGTRSTKRISAASLPKLYKTPGYHHDGGGLYLQVTSSGSRSWIFRFMLNKRAREMGLGAADNWDLTTVRQKVGELRRLLDDGIDPIEQRDRERRLALNQQALSRTFEQCADQYHELNAETWKNAKHAAQFKSTLKTYACPVFGDWPVEQISEGDVLKVLLPIWKTKHETATRVLGRVRTVLTWSAAVKYRPAMPDGFWDHITAQLPKVERVSAHHAACPYSEAGALLLQVRDSGATDIVKLAFMFTVLTAARSGEARGATWAEIDMEKAIWIVPAQRMKAGLAHQVPLSDSAIAVLTAAKKLAGESKLVFPNRMDRPFSDMTFTQLLRRLEAGCTMHGFRSTFRDWAAEQTNYPREVCEVALAHVTKDKTEAAYLRTDFFDKRRNLMADWARFLEGTAPHTISPEASGPPAAVLSTAAEPL